MFLHVLLVREMEAIRSEFVITQSMKLYMTLVVYTEKVLLMIIVYTYVNVTVSIHMLYFEK